MKIVVLNEGSSDSRVSASPETVKKIKAVFNQEKLIQKVKKKVFDKTGIDLELELQIIGEEL